MCLGIGFNAVSLVLQTARTRAPPLLDRKGDGCVWKRTFLFIQPRRSLRSKTPTAFHRQFGGHEQFRENLVCESKKNAWLLK